jgi:hypothetical protein
VSAPCAECGAHDGGAGGGARRRWSVMAASDAAGMVGPRRPAGTARPPRAAAARLAEIEADNQRLLNRMVTILQRTSQFGTSGAERKRARSDRARERESERIERDNAVLAHRLELAGPRRQLHPHPPVRRLMGNARPGVPSSRFAEATASPLDLALASHNEPGKEQGRGSPRPAAGCMLAFSELRSIPSLRVTGPFSYATLAPKHAEVTMVLDRVLRTIEVRVALDALARPGLSQQSSGPHSMILSCATALALVPACASCGDQLFAQLAERLWFRNGTLMVTDRVPRASQQIPLKALRLTAGAASVADAASLGGTASAAGAGEGEGEGAGLNAPRKRQQGAPSAGAVAPKLATDSTTGRTTPRGRTSGFGNSKGIEASRHSYRLSIIRGRPKDETDTREQAEVHASAVLLQSKFRAHLARSRYLVEQAQRRQDRDEMERASALIQSSFRAHAERKRRSLRDDEARAAAVERARLSGLEAAGKAAAAPREASTEEAAREGAKTVPSTEIQASPVRASAGKISAARTVCPVSAPSPKSSSPGSAARTASRRATSPPSASASTPSAFSQSESATSPPSPTCQPAKSERKPKLKDLEAKSVHQTAEAGQEAERRASLVLQRSFRKHLAERHSELAPSEAKKPGLSGSAAQRKRHSETHSNST